MCRWAGNEPRVRDNRSNFKIVIGKLGGKRFLGRPRRRWKEYIRMTLKEIGVNTRNWD